MRRGVSDCLPSIVSRIEFVGGFFFAGFVCVFLFSGVVFDSSAENCFVSCSRVLGGAALCAAASGAVGMPTQHLRDG